MSRTTRAYNRQYILHNSEGWYRIPYGPVCMGHCHTCKDPTVSKRRRLAYKNEMRRAAKEEAML